MAKLAQTITENHAVDEHSAAGRTEEGRGDTASSHLLSEAGALSSDALLEAGRAVLETEIAGLNALNQSLDQNFATAAQWVRSAKGRVILSGMGKSGHIACKIAATLASTGTPSQFVHPAEASHGDLGMITTDDLCILISNSGETRELADLLAYTRRFAISTIAITKKTGSTLAKQADLILTLPDVPEACSIGMAPTTSTTCTLALGDALAVAVMNARGFDASNYSQFHPGGQLGAQLIPVSDLMESGPHLPRLSPDAPMQRVLDEINEKSLGMALVVDDDDKLLGIITDGDLRRNLDGLMEKTADQIATKNPKVISSGALAGSALKLMNEKSILVLAVVDSDKRLEGVIHMHACLRAGIV